MAQLPARRGLLHLAERPASNRAPSALAPSTRKGETPGTVAVVSGARAVGAQRWRGAGARLDTAACPSAPSTHPPGTANVRRGLIPDAALRKGDRIFTETSRHRGNEAAPGATGKPTRERRLTAFSPAVRPRLTHAPPAAPRALPGSPPRRRGGLLLRDPGRAASAHQRREGAAQAGTRPCYPPRPARLPPPLTSPYLRGPGARGRRGRPAPRRPGARSGSRRRLPARPTWAGLSGRPARAEPKRQPAAAERAERGRGAAAAAGGNSRAGREPSGRA